MPEYVDRNGISITIVDRIKDWDALKLAWNTLWENSPDASVFMSHTFLKTWWSEFKKSPKSLFVLVLRDRLNEIVGIAPLVRQWEWHAGFPLRTIRMMEQAWLTDRPQFLSSTDRRDQLQAIFRFLVSGWVKWDALWLREQLLDRDYLDVIEGYFGSANEFRYDRIEESIAPYLEIPPVPDGWKPYLQSRSKKHRKKWRYYHNRLKGSGEVEIFRHQSGSALEDGIHAYEIMEKNSWKRNKCHVSRKEFDFYRRLARSIEGEGSVNIVMLHLDGKPISGLIGLAVGKRYAALHSSFDDRYSDFSPGFLIGGYDMKWAIENGFREYDFMSGFPTDKLQWTDTFRRTSQVRAFRKRTWGGLFVFTKFHINLHIRNLAARLGIAQSYKKYIDKKYPRYNISKFDKHNDLVNRDKNSSQETIQAASKN